MISHSDVDRHQKGRNGEEPACWLQLPLYVPWELSAEHLNLVLSKITKQEKLVSAASSSAWDFVCDAGECGLTLRDKIREAHF